VLPDQPYEYLEQELRIAPTLQRQIISGVGTAKEAMPFFVQDAHADSLWATPGTSGLYRLYQIRRLWPEVDAVLAVDVEVSVDCNFLFGEDPRNDVFMSFDAWLLRQRDMVALYHKTYDEWVYYDKMTRIEDTEVKDRLSSVANELVSDLCSYIGRSPSQ
jgi:hypothetical protein